MRSPLPSVLVAFVLAPWALAQEPVRANYKLAEKFSSEHLRKFVYSTSVRPEWIAGTDSFYYSFRTSAGTRWWLVDAKNRTKTPLFDHAAVAAAVTQATQKAVDANALRVSGVRIEKDGKAIRFNSGGFHFKYDRATRAVRERGKARSSWRDRTGNRGPGATEGMSREEIMEMMREQQRERREDDGERERGNTERGNTERGNTERGFGGRGTFGRGGGLPPGGFARGATVQNTYAPDRSMYVYAKDHNLFLVRGTKAATPITPAAAPANGNGAAKSGTSEGAVKSGTDGTGAEKNGAATAAVVEAPAPQPGAASPRTPPEANWVYDTEHPRQLSKDGIEDYSFGGATRGATGGGTRTTRSTQNNTRNTTQNNTQNNTQNDTRTNRGTRFGRGRGGGGGPSISWSKDSTAFYATRRDSRGMKDLFLIDSVADPRPSLQTYKYSMPGEEEIRKTELHYFHVASGKLQQLPKKWIDESYQDLSWTDKGGKLRFMRRDRLLRNVEYCALDPQTGKVDVLFAEGSKDGYLKLQNPRRLEKRKQFIWWSERTGWGHYYLYDLDGKLVNQITKGGWRASRIVAVDEEKGVLYFRGNGREPGENIYYEHNYRVNLDGTGLTLLDPGDANHRVSFSPDRKYIVDNTSRVDAVPASCLRDADGKLLMELETTDLSKLTETGWQMPETFTVKAADGVTTLYGNLWKPFDFDAKKKYPIILHVYPGPQQEGVTHTFSATNGRQELAQLGFVVVQVGHRGGTPDRSRAYANYGYYNLRDYGLADKKAAVEQLAQRHDWIDGERVGIFGHSGGGFMSAAALLKPPYNKFFKVAVASAGNHDNNIYNHSWSERYHGLKEVKAGETSTTEGSTNGTSTTETSTRGSRRGRTRGTRTGREATEGAGAATRTTTAQGTEDEKEDPKTRLQIKVPTNAELAANLEGHLLLVHGEIDNNVHPANTMRLVDALIKANKRFDLLIIPGARHSFGRAQGYFTRRMWEYFAEHLLDDRREGADILK